MGGKDLAAELRMQPPGRGLLLAHNGTFTVLSLLARWIGLQRVRRRLGKKRRGIAGLLTRVSLPSL